MGTIDGGTGDIPPTEDLVLPERLAKGDLFYTKNLKGKINRAAQIDRSVIKELLRLEVLQFHHEIYGFGFLELRAAFRAPWAASSSAVLLGQWGIGISPSKAGEIYQNVCRGMRGRGLEVVQFALEGTKERAWKYERGLYQEHFERLVSLMDEERERISREPKNY